MAEEKKRVSPQLLKNLVPISQLTADNLRDLAEKTFVEVLPPGKALFKRGDSDNNSYYLLTGDVWVDVGVPPNKVIAAGTPPARFPLDHHRPRQATISARSEIQYIKIDNDLLDILLTWDQNAGYMVSEIEATGDEKPAGDDTDWMTNILRSSIFHRIPPTNIQKMFMRMEAVPVKTGEVIIKQGDEGDFYYYISKGRCLVTRDSSKGGVIKLAELDPGASFGEEALISGAKRNANVTMLTEGTLMRLSKADFEALLKGPVLEEVTYEQAQEMAKKESAVWLDVRLENEHKNYALPGSVHIPLYLLRLKAGALDKNKKYIVYCDTGRRSSSAVYLLSERGIQAVVLKGGLMSLKQEQQPG